MLCLGAHSDDVEIGCAGTLLRLAERPEALHVRWVVFSGDRERAREARESAARLVEEGDSLKVDVHDFRDGFFPEHWAEIKETFEDLKQEREPDLVFTHRLEDRHQDHRTIADLTWNTFRNHLILEYEIPKYEGDLGEPNAYVPLSAETARRKADHLSKAFPSQRGKSWFEEETFVGLARLRGVECGAEEKHAEAFRARKAILDL